MPSKRTRARTRRRNTNALHGTIRVLHERKDRLASGDVLMSRIDAPLTGADLRAAREKLGWDLDAVASGLRIRRPFLEAIEDGRMSDLPGPAYAIGFVRTYAAALGLDQEEMARRFRAEAGNLVARKTDLAFPEPVPERGVPAGAVVLIALVLGIGGYVAWHRWSARTDMTADTVAPVPARIEAEVALPPPVSPPSVSPPSAPPAPAAMAPALSPAAPPASSTPGTGIASVPAPDPLPSSSPQQTAALPPVTVPGPARITLPGGQPQSLAVAPPPIVVTPPPASIPPSSAAAAVPPIAADRLVIRAKGDSWINIRDRQGQVLLNRVLKAGESWTAPEADLAALVMTTGNGGGTEILVDGTPVASLGASGAVRRDISLDPERLRDMPPPAARPAAPPQPQ